MQAVRLTFVAMLAIPGIAVAQSVEELRRELDAMKQKVQALEEKLERIESPPPAPAAAAAPAAPAPTALDRALESARRETVAPQADPKVPAAVAQSAVLTGALLSGRVGGATLRLVDVSFNILTAAGWSTADDEEIEILEGGAHDPKRRGFTLQQGELSLMGAVDPYFTGEAHMIFTEDEVELEEAFARTTALPYGLQAMAGYFFTRFGRQNWQHPHAWDWMDQPVILTRLFGGEGLRNSGVEGSWLVPLPWYTEFKVSAQNATGGTAISFLGEGEEDDGDEHGHGGEQGPIGGRPVVERNVDHLDDLLYMARLQTGFTLTDELSAAIGWSALFGPNATGGDERSTIYGTDLVMKWRPATNFRGWPFLTWQTEIMQRDFEAAAVPDMNLPATTLYDWGLYSQLLWGFHYRWAAGVRYEYADGTGQSVGGLNQDPYRSARTRVAPLLVWQTSEFSRLRLQYNFDDARFLPERDASSVWLGLEVGFGAHPAHQY